MNVKNRFPDPLKVLPPQGTELIDCFQNMLASHCFFDTEDLNDFMDEIKERNPKAIDNYLANKHDEGDGNDGNGLRVLDNEVIKFIEFIRVFLFVLSVF